MAIPKYEYSGPYRWDEARERIPNDYRTKDDKPTEYNRTPGTEEDTWEEWERLKEADIETDIIY